MVVRREEAPGPAERKIPFRSAGERWIRFITEPRGGVPAGLAGSPLMLLLGSMLAGFAAGFLVRRQTRPSTTRRNGGPGIFAALSRSMGGDRRGV